jgi:hypothetical protein
MRDTFFGKRASWAPAALALVAMPCAAGSFTFTAINDPSSNQNTFVYGINNNGVVVGQYGSTQSFTYNGSVYTTLNDPSAANPYGTGNTFAQGINDSGSVVGFYYNGSGYSGFLYNGSAYTTLNDPSGINGYGGTQANGINDSGEVVGLYCMKLIREAMGSFTTDRLIPR